MRKSIGEKSNAIRCFVVHASAINQANKFANETKTDPRMRQEIKIKESERELSEEKTMHKKVS